MERSSTHLIKHAIFTSDLIRFEQYNSIYLKFIYFLPPFSKVCNVHNKQSTVNASIIFYIILLSFDFCPFCVVIRFFHPRHNSQWPPKDFYTRSYPLHYFLILILEKEPVFPFSMLSAKQGNYWYHFYNVFGMKRSLTGDWTRDLQHSTTRLSRRRYKKQKHKW